MVTLAGRVYSSMKSVQDRFASIRDAGPGDIEGEDLCFIADLATFHPKMPNCTVLRALNGKGKPPYGHCNAVWVRYSDGRGVQWDTLAAGPAARTAVFGAAHGQEAYERNCVNDNFRVAIEGQRKEFKAERECGGGAILCAVCDAWKPSHECDVDHTGSDALMFNALVRQFVQKEVASNACFDATSHFGREVYNDQSAAVRRWVDYHKERACLQMLCKPCHYAKSGGETSRRSVSAKKQRTAGRGIEKVARGRVLRRS